MTHLDLMHGSDWSPEHDITGWIVTEKIDGIRVFITGGKMYTRTGVEIPCPWEFSETLTLDCELYGKPKDLQNIHKRKDQSVWEKLTIYLLDLPIVMGDYRQRRSRFLGIVNLFTYLRSQFTIASVLDFDIDSLDRVVDAFNKVKSRDGEGLMLYDPSAIYKPGRTKSLLKVKDTNFPLLLQTAWANERKPRVNAKRGTRADSSWVATTASLL